MNDFVERLGWVLVHSLWQFALMALLAGVTVQSLRRRSAALRYVVLVVAMVVSVAAPLATWMCLPNDQHNDLASRVALAPGRDAIAEGSPGADAARLADGPAVVSDVKPEVPARDSVPMRDVLESRPVASSLPVPIKPAVNWTEQATSILRPWLAWIVTGWCLGVVLCSLRPLLGWQTLWRLKRVGVSAASDEVLAAMSRVSQQLGLHCVVRVMQSTLAQVPIVVGYFQPVILLPLSLVTSIPAAQLEAILAHELAHVRRHDFIVNLLQTLVETLFFYHPAVWWLSHQIRVEREHCCDDIVVNVLGNRVEYGRALLAIEELRGRSTVLALGATDGSLLSRVRRIVGVGPDRLNDRWPVAFVGLLTIGLVLTMAFGSFVATRAEVEQPKTESTASSNNANSGNETRFPPPKPDDVRGLDLSKVAVRGYEEAYRSLPDLYGPYAKSVFLMPLAEHTWLEYPAGSGHFYIQHRHDGTPQSEQIYGPIEGDPFEVLKLEDLLREQMKPGATSGDPRYRLRLMLRNGEPGLVRRAWRMIEPELAPKFVHKDEHFYQRFELFEGVRDALRDRPEVFRNPELKEIVAQARQRVEAAEAEFDELNGFGVDAGADDGYEAVTYLQPKIAAKIPESLWGKPLDGLRLALVPREWTPGTDWNELPLDTPLPASITVEPGQERSYQLVVENVSDHEIKICGYFLGEETHRTLEVLDSNGKLAETQGLHTTIPSFPSYWRLKPGERQLLSMPAVHFMPAQSNDPNQGLGYFVKTAPGEYTLRCNYVFGLYDNTRHRHIPDQGVWVGQLTTGTQKITVADPTTAKTNSGRGAPDSALDPTESRPKSDDGQSKIGNSNEDLRPEPETRAVRGEILWVDAKRGVVGISLGVDDGIKKRMRFQVREKETKNNRTQPPVVKGKVEVTRIIDRNTIEARIVEEDVNNGLAKGDPVLLLFETTLEDEQKRQEARPKKPPEGELYDRAIPRNDRLQPGQSEKTSGKVSAPISDTKRLKDPRRAPQESPKPKGKEAQALFKKWQEGARANGNIPGGALGPLVRVMTNFIKNNPTHEGAPKFAELLKRIDVSRDWSREEAVKLLDEVSAIYPTLPDWVLGENRFALGGDIETGQPLPVELKNAPWGEARPNGLRVVWLLEPRALKYRIGTPLRSVILFHNAGKSSVVFRALTFNQSGSHKASDANGADINISSVEWTTLPRVIACRLAPGEYIEMTAPGIGVGARNKDDEDWRGIRVGSWIDAKVGDEVTFTPSPVSASGQEQDEPLDEAQLNKPLKWWLDFITDRLSLDLPLPADAAERGRILKRATRDLFGNEPTAEEVTAFTIDAAPDALGRLAKRLAQRPGFAPFSGSLTSGTRKFLVLSADPDAATKPRTANNPGRYTLGDHTRLVVTRRPIGERIVNEARIEFYSPDSIKPAPGEPHEIKLPDGYDTWSAAWMRGETVLWVQQKGTVRSYDFTNPAVVKETVIEDPTLGDKVPQPILDALRAALDVPVEPKPATTETSPPDGLEFLKPYPKLHGLSYEMTEKQFLEIAKQQGLKPHRSPEAKNPRYEIGTGDGHTVIVMFGNKGEKCSGIQRVRGDLAPPSDESISLTDSVRDFNDENKQLAIGQDQPPMSADEAVAAIKQSKWEVDPDRINQQEIAAFKAVAESRRLPKGSYFQVRTGDQHETFLVRHYWLIELYLPAIGHDGFVGFTIRDTKLNDEKIDPKLIAWGKPDADGLSLGAYLSPKKETYQLGERIRLRLFVRNDSQQQVETTWMNSSHPLPEDFTITDESGAQVAVRIGHESWDHAWVSGTRTGGIAPGEAHTFFVPYEIRIGGGAAKEANKLIGRVIEARAGQTLQLRVRSHNGNHRKRADNEPEPESGIVAFKVIEPTAAAAITK